MGTGKKEDAETVRPPPRVKPLQRRDGSWCAEAMWPYAPASHVGSFKTEDEVRDWIVQNSNEYFRKCSKP